MILWVSWFNIDIIQIRLKIHHPIICTYKEDQHWAKVKIFKLYSCLWSKIQLAKWGKGFVFIESNFIYFKWVYKVYYNLKYFPFYNNDNIIIIPNYYCLKFLISKRISNWGNRIWDMGKRREIFWRWRTIVGEKKNI